MSRDVYLIYTPGRTGSTLIVGNLSKYFTSDVQQIHNPLYELQYDGNTDYICVLSRRHNTFDAILSQLILEKTNEPHIYSNSDVTPFSANIDQFKTLYQIYTTFYSKINLPLFKKVVEVWYEDLVLNPYYLFNQFGVNEKTDYNFSNKSPYDPYKLITNINELKQIEIDITTERNI